MTTTDQQTTPVSPELKRHARFWIGLVAAIFVLQMTGAAALIYYAHSDAGFSVTPDYYEKAQHWDEQVALRAASDALGWKAGLSVGDEDGPLRRREVIITLLDASGAMLDGASVSASAIFNARADNPEQLTFHETAPGVYVATLLTRRVGLWVFNVRAERGDNVFVQEIRTDIYPPTKGSA
jgi:nitrogen fixation protein FixH